MSDLPQIEAPPSAKKAGEIPNVDINRGNAIQFDQLGPIVVNSDGTMSRIPNWHEMTDVEKERTVRILAKRNQQRTERLRAESNFSS